MNTKLLKEMAEDLVRHLEEALKECKRKDSEKGDKPMTVRVVRYFSANVSKYGSPTFLTFTPGEIINDTSLAEELLRLKCPVVDAQDMRSTICPKCRAVCSSEAHAREVTVVQANAGFSYNGQYFSFRTGDILPYPWLIEQAKENRIPLEIATGVECWNCKHLWY